MDIASEVIQERSSIFRRGSIPNFFKKLSKNDEQADMGGKHEAIVIASFTETGTPSSSNSRLGWEREDLERDDAWAECDDLVVVGSNTKSADALQAETDSTIRLYNHLLHTAEAAVVDSAEDSAHRMVYSSAMPICDRLSMARALITGQQAQLSQLQGKLVELQAENTTHVTRLEDEIDRYETLDQNRHNQKMSLQRTIDDDDDDVGIAADLLWQLEEEERLEDGERGRLLCALEVRGQTRDTIAIVQMHVVNMTLKIGEQYTLLRKLDSSVSPECTIAEQEHLKMLVKAMEVQKKTESGVALANKVVSEDIERVLASALTEGGHCKLANRAHELDSLFQVLV